MYLYAIDLGGTAVKHAVVNWPDPHCPEHSYQLLEKSSFPTPYKDADHLITLLNSKIPFGSLTYSFCLLADTISNTLLLTILI